MKALSAAHCMHDTASLQLLPNIGPALAADLESVGVHCPRDLIGRDAFALYQALCVKTGRRQDPCVLDTFMAVIDFMQGAPAAPWWRYTPQRKRLYGPMPATGLDTHGRPGHAAPIPNRVAGAATARPATG